MDRGRFLSQGFLIVLIAVAAGCGLFDPRDPRSEETPVIPERCRILTAPDSVVENILVHYGRVTGQTCYEALVDPAFAFYPDTQDSLERENPPPNPFSGWNRAVELSVTQTIALQTSFIGVFFDGEYRSRTTTTNPTTETRYYNYHLLVRAKSSPDTLRYQGKAELTFVQETALYSLKYWRDQRDGSGLPTWGSLRADNRTASSGT